MPIVARRFTILTLLMMIFALAFSALAVQPGRRGLHLQSSLTPICSYSQPCAVSL